MIIDFTIQNFRSLRHEALLSMHVEQPKTHLLENISYPLNDKMGVLRTAGIYGANASGKSNILMALRALRWLVEESGDLREDARISCYEPYSLAERNRHEPISFEIEFISSDNLRYIYAVSYKRTEIVSESLDYYPSRQKANIFKRVEGDTWETISFGGHYKGGVKRIPLFKNNCYLSKAGNNAGASDHIRSVYEYFRTIISFGFNQKVSLSLLYAEEPMFKQAADLLASFDTGIVGVTKKESKNEHFKYLPENLPGEVKEQLIRQNKYDFVFAHKTESGALVNFRQSLESDGTQKLFELIPGIITALQAGCVLVVDELDNSFHPHIAELIIRLFNDEKVNKHNAQLIFTTHNIHLMSSKLFRRDQIWFAEKNGGNTKLYSLDEFDKGTVKTSSPFAEWYDDGRFGAVPHLQYSDIAAVILTPKTLRSELDESKAEDEAQGVTNA